jgi:hypothetical protein
MTRQQWWDTVPVHEIKSLELKSIDVRDFGNAAVAVCEYTQEAVVLENHGAASFS